MKEISWLPMN